MTTEYFSENASSFTGQILFDEPLKKHTYYRIGGPARVLAVPKSMDDLAWISRAIQVTKTPYFILGQGSNLLVSDAGFDGLVVKAARVNQEVTLIAEDRLRVGASVAVSSLLRRGTQEGWGGLEFLTGIPGSVGGVVVMNAGTHLGEAKDRILKVEVFQLSNGKTCVFENDVLQFQYRKNLFLPVDGLVTSTEWKIEKRDPAAVKAIVDETLARRKASQPVDYPSCGSVFKNPREHMIHAWHVIEKLGLRGHRIGRAQFSEKHPNFIINLDHATAADVKALIELAKSRARDELGIVLEEEVRHLG